MNKKLLTTERVLLSYHREGRKQCAQKPFDFEIPGTPASHDGTQI